MRQKNCIGILSFNKINLTERCLGSVLASGYDPGIIFLYHNGSDTKTRDQLMKKFPQINHHWSGINTGYSGGFNSVMKWIFGSGGRSVLFLTNDTTIDKLTLSNCLGTEESAGSGFIAPAIHYLKYPEKIDSCGGFFDRSRFTLSHYHELSLPDILEPGKDYIPGTALWMRKDVFKKTGGMDEKYHTYWEDADLSFRCHEKGIEMARCFTANIYHGIGQTCHKKSLYTTFYFQRNRIIFCKEFLKGDELEKALLTIKTEIDEMKKKASLKKNIKKLEYIDELKTFF
ncbi:MAG: glycosyltransferase [Acidobacteriota bacterium]